MTHGTVSKGKDGRWAIETKPHVAMRLKRVFGKIAKAARGTLYLEDTPETCRDLLWFMERYPHDMTEDDRLAMSDRAAYHRALEERARLILSGEADPRLFQLALPLRKYQAEAAELALVTRGLLLADEVGLGKTAVAIGVMVHPEARPALVVCYPHLQGQWEREVKRFAPGLTVHTLRSTTPYDLASKRRDADQLALITPRLPDVILSSYHKLSGWAEALSGVVRTCVFDEVQELRKSDSAKYGGARQIAEKAEIRLGLSATPIYNYGDEFHSVFGCLRPGALGSKTEFLTEWSGHDGKTIKDPRAFGSYLRDEALMLRRTRHDVSRELPAVSVMTQEVEADPSSLRDVKDAAAELARIILDDGRKGFDKMQAGQELDWKMRQATGIGKALSVAAFVRLLVECGERVVLFGWHREVYALWESALADLKPAFFTGAESPVQKALSLRRFTTEDAKVLIMSLRAGAGVDGLQAVSRTVVFGELDWSPGVHAQCLDAETEILTRRGFRNHRALKLEDEVAAFDRETEAIRWRPLLRKVERPLGEGERMYAIKSPTLDIRVTDGHRMVYKQRRGKARRWSNWEIATAEALARRSQTTSIPVAGMELAPGVALSDDQLRVIGWFVTDGTMNLKARQLCIVQAEASPYNADIRACLDGAGLRWTVSRSSSSSQWRRNSPMLRYAVPKYGAKNRAIPGYGWATLEPYLDKNLSPLLEGMTAAQLAVFLEAVHMGDGNKQRGQSWTQRTYHIGTGRWLFAERLQSLCVRRCFRANLAEKRTPQGRPHWMIHIRPDPERSLGGKSQRDRQTFKEVEASPDELVWCVENDLGTIVIRRNGKVAIVGNCLGRVHRDGQPDPVMAYYLVAETGSDPVVADVLGLKRQQLEQVRDPDAPLVEALSVDPNHIRRLAEACIQERRKAA